MMTWIYNLLKSSNLIVEWISSMTQLEFYKSFLFPIELMVAEGLFLATLKKRDHFVLRLLGGIFAFILFAILFPAITNNALYMCFMFICLFLFTIGVSKFIFKESFAKLLFCCVAGYTVQHLTYQLNNIVSLALTNGTGDVSMGMYGMEFAPMFSNPFFTIIYFFIYIITYLCCYYIFARRLDSENFVLTEFSNMILVIAMLVIDVVLNAFVVCYVSVPVGVMLSGLYNIICCVFGLILQCQVIYSCELQNHLKMERIARRFERERYAAVKEAMDTINIKCHDLKYQEWKKKVEGKDAETDAEIEEAIAEYSRFTYTGNIALDIVLSEINQQCSKLSINASYMADGRLLSFMKEEDVYSLFGNLLSNAVEAVSKLPEDKRTMGLKIESRFDDLLSISVYNYCGEEKFVFEDSLPQTTKNNRELHGFGLKSVRHMCDKYDASLDIFIDQGIFHVDILMPTLSSSTPPPPSKREKRSMRAYTKK